MKREQATKEKGSQRQQSAKTADIKAIVRPSTVNRKLGRHTYIQVITYVNTLCLYMRFVVRKRPQNPISECL